MSERTTIGGTVYEAIGSSSSNLLLRCNGTARIQWGGRLIDLIKNGKIASSDSKELIFIVSDESEIKSDGIYILTTEESPQLLIYKDGNKYDFTSPALYISASDKQNLTVEQKAQALDNIGIQYDTLEALKQAGIQNGIAYVLETKTLYTIKNSVIEEFEAKLKIVTVENGTSEGDQVNSTDKIVLSILDDEYLILADQRITANYSIHVRDSAQIGSENADKTQGYRLYIEGGTSYLDVDKINVRKGLGSVQYQEITFDDLKQLINNKSLVPHEWYLLTDFQNHWKMSVISKNNRPLLIRALDESNLYETGYLFQNHKICIKYNPNYQESINQIQTDGSEITVTTKGQITWMKDQYGNEATFDFLDYTDCNDNPLTILHEGSIFPKDSYNNKLFVENLKGTIINNNIIDDTNTYTIEFSENIKNMHDNFLQVKNLKVDCVDFYNNTLTDVFNLEINADCYDNTINDINNIQITQIIRNCKITSFTDSVINATLNNCKFQEIKECTFGEGNIENVTSYCNLSSVNFDQVQYELLYNSLKVKEIYNVSDKLEILCIPDVIFYRGMIIMHSGIEPIPPGWAPCDGKEYSYNGVTSKTPDLTNRFIKAVTTVEDIKATDNDSLNENGEIVLTVDNLPAHSHPHKAHTHSFSESGTAYATIGALTSSEEGTVITAIEGGTEGKAITKTTYKSDIEVYDSNVAVSGDTSSVTSEESDWLYKTEPDPINMMPNYYSLIFIMKL